MECVIANSPCGITLFASRRHLICLTVDAKIHDVVPADSAVVNDYVPCPQSYCIPLLHFKTSLAAVFAFPPNKYVILNVTLNPEEWPEFFSLPVIFLMIITVINDGTLISIGYDYAVPSKYPERWVLPVLFIISISLGAIACLSSLILLYFCLTSFEKNNLLYGMGIRGLRYGHIVNIIFLKVAVTDILTLFSSRTSHQFFFQRKPHLILVGCTSLALCTTTILSLTWPCGTLDSIPVCGLAYEGGYNTGHKLIALWVWIYCFIVFLIQDCVKVLAWRIVIRLNLFNINNEVKGVKIMEEIPTNEPFT